MAYLLLEKLKGIGSERFWLGGSDQGEPGSGGNFKWIDGSVFNLTEDKFWATPKNVTYNCMVIEENTKFSGMECYWKYDTPNDQKQPVIDIFYLCAHNINNAGSISIMILYVYN